MLMEDLDDLIDATATVNGTNTNDVMSDDEDDLFESSADVALNAEKSAGI